MLGNEFITIKSPRSVKGGVEVELKAFSPFPK